MAKKKFEILYRMKFTNGIEFYTKLFKPFEKAFTSWKVFRTFSKKEVCDAALKICQEYKQEDFEFKLNENN